MSVLRALGAKLQGHLRRLLLRPFPAAGVLCGIAKSRTLLFIAVCLNKNYSTIFPAFLSMDTGEKGNILKGILAYALNSSS